METVIRPLFVRVTVALVTFILALGVLVISLSCDTKQPDRVPTNGTTPTPASTPEAQILWPSDPTEEVTDNKPLKLAWKNIERSQKYRLALRSDRNLIPAAAARVKSNNPNQIRPFLTWWGARGYRGSDTKDFLIAIVVDPSRTDPNRYGLLVLAKVASEGPHYKQYWVLREEDMESYLISPASGSVYIECFRRDGTQQTKELAWDRNSRQFRLR
jgi:hypothetical protein